MPLGQEISKAHQQTEGQYDQTSAEHHAKGYLAQRQHDYRIKAEGCHLSKAAASKGNQAHQISDAAQQLCHGMQPVENGFSVRQLLQRI